MDPFAAFALTFGMIVAASQQAAIMEQYAAHGRQAYAAAPAAPPVPGWVQGAAVDSQVGAATLAEPSRPRGSASSREFTDHWQRFMQPSVGRSARPAP